MSLRVMTQGGGTGGASASIFVTGLDENRTVTATKDGKTVRGKWVTKEKLVETQIPTMTSNTNPSGVATSSTVDATYYAYRAFDGKLDTFGWNPSSADSFGKAYVQYEFEEPIVPNRIDLATIEGGVATHHVTYRVEASLDLSKWDVLVNDLYVGNYATYNKNTINTNKSYKYFKLILVSGHGGATIVNTNGHKMQVYGTKIKDVSGHEIAIKEYGMWTVTATNGEETKTQDVLVDAAVEYTIEIVYVSWLYREGDQREEVTGGWKVVKNTGMNCTLTTSGIKFVVTGTSGRDSAAYTNKKINVTNRTKLVATATKTNKSALYIGLYSTNTEPYPLLNMTYKKGTSATGANTEELVLDISDVTGEYYIVAASDVTDGYIDNIRLV